MVFVGAAGLWQLNGRSVGQGSRVHWQPRPGRHVLERRDAGKPLAAPDRVVFEVRAAPPPAATGRKGSARKATPPRA